MSAVVAASHALAPALAVLTLGLAVVFGIFRTDDILFDVTFWITYIRKRRILARHERFSVDRLNERAQQRIAIFVPCWHEADVVDRMLDVATRFIEYYNYDIIIGAYPNDPETIVKVRQMMSRSNRIKLAINETEGPTTKAQNLNAIFREMKRIEGDKPYQIVVLHDVEDIIHPLSLKLYNYLMPDKAMVQIPVFPLERSLKRFTAWTYADEFARNHCEDMILRERMGSFVPSAGVGCAFSREGLDMLAQSSTELFPEGALTEDYQFAWKLHLAGKKTIFVNKRLAAKGKDLPSTAAAYVATRAYFPDTIETAIKQKTRWVAGIGLQSWHAMGWNGNLANKYMLLRDRRAVFTNILALFGYAGLAVLAFLWIAYFLDPRVELPPLPRDGWGALLLDYVVLLTCIELIETACFTAWVYGVAAGITSILRAPVGTLINGVASIRATYFFLRSIFTGKAMAWSKTDHTFPTEAELSTFRRSIGELLVERGVVSQEEVALALAEQAVTRERLGELLIRLGKATPADVDWALEQQLQNGIEDEDQQTA